MDTDYSEEDEVAKLKEYKRILCTLDRDKEIREQRRESLNQIGQRKRRPSIKLDHRCKACNSFIDTNDVTKYLQCKRCAQTICRQKSCSMWLPKECTWICRPCACESDSTAGEWILDELWNRFPSTPDVRSSVAPLMRSRHSVPNLNSTSGKISFEDRERVRDIIESLLARMLNGSIDSVSVSQMNSSDEYLPYVDNHESPITVHDNLRKLVQTIVEEVIKKVPNIIDQSGIPVERTPVNVPYFDAKSYEQLLATAVLNKVLDSYSYEKKFDKHSTPFSRSFLNSSNGLNYQNDIPSTSTSTEPRSLSSAASNHSDFQLSLRKSYEVTNDAGIDTNASSPATSPVGSSEENYLSDYIQSHKVPLPDLSLEEDSLFHNSREDNSWDENWVFKKRIGQNEVPSIAMLVPSPTEDIKALIGDRTADEISDLSETEDSDRDLNDFDEDNDAIDIDLPHISLERKVSAGGTIDNGDLYANAIQSLDYLLQPENSVESDEFNDKNSWTETKNKFLTADSAVETVRSIINDNYASEDSFEQGVFNEVILNNHKTALSNGFHNTTQVGLPEKNEDDVLNNNKNVAQKDTQEDSHLIIVAAEEPHQFNGTSNVSLDSVNSILQNLNVTVDSPLRPLIMNPATSTTTPPSTPGSIAEREHLKWQNAADIPNNPYAPEALIKRLSQGIEISSDLERACFARVHSEEFEHTSEVACASPTTNDAISKLSRDYYINDASIKAAPTTPTREDDQLSSPLPHQKPLETEEENVLKTTDSPTLGVTESVEETSTSEVIAEPVIEVQSIKPAEMVLVDTKIEEIAIKGLVKEEVPTPTVPLETHEIVSIKSLVKEEASTSTVPLETQEILGADVKETTITMEPVLIKSAIEIEEIAAIQNITAIQDVPKTISKDSSEIIAGLTKIVSEPLLQEITPATQIAQQKTEIKCNDPETVPVLEDPEKTKVTNLTPVVPIESTDVAGNADMTPANITAVVNVLDDAKALTIDSLSAGDIKLKEKTSSIELDKIIVTSLEVTPSPKTEDLDEISKISISSSEASSSIDASLTQSEDSDAVRVYDLSNREKKVLRDAILKKAKNPIGGLQEDADVSIRECDTEHRLEQIKSFDRLNFIVPRQKNILEELLSPDKEASFPRSPSVEKVVIEEDVVSTLPSVRQLAKTFSINDCSKSPTSFNKPKVKFRKSLLTVLASQPHTNKQRRPSSEEEIPDFHVMAPGHSITARSLSRHIRQELKSIDSSETNNNNTTETASETPNAQTNNNEARSRSPSPIPPAGILRSNLAFFENLGQK